MYGSQYHEQLSDVIRRAAEFCDCLQCFFVLHSMGGGKCGFYSNIGVREVVNADLSNGNKWLQIVYSMRDGKRQSFHRFATFITDRNTQSTSI